MRVMKHKRKKSLGESKVSFVIHILPLRSAIFEHLSSFFNVCIVFCLYPLWLSFCVCLTVHLFVQVRCLDHCHLWLLSHDIISISWMPRREKKEKEVIQWSVAERPQGLGLNGAEPLNGSLTDHCIQLYKHTLLFFCPADDPEKDQQLHLHGVVWACQIRRWLKSFQ